MKGAEDVGRGTHEFFIENHPWGWRPRWVARWSLRRSSASLGSRACALDQSRISANLNRGRGGMLRGWMLQTNKALPTANAPRQRDFHYSGPYRLPKAVGKGVLFRALGGAL